MYGDMLTCLYLIGDCSNGRAGQACRCRGIGGWGGGGGEVRGVGGWVGGRVYFVE